MGTAVDYWNTLQANRFIVTTTKQPSRNGSRVILVLTPELLNEATSEEILGAIPGKTVLGIKLRNCHRCGKENFNFLHWLLGPYSCCIQS